MVGNSGSWHQRPEDEELKMLRASTDSRLHCSSDGRAGGGVERGGCVGRRGETEGVYRKEEEGYEVELEDEDVEE